MRNEFNNNTTQFIRLTHGSDSVRFTNHETNKFKDIYYPNQVYTCISWFDIVFISYNLPPNFFFRRKKKFMVKSSFNRTK